MTIVDRGLGQAVPPGVFDAVIYQATHDRTGLDVGFEAFWTSPRAQEQVRGAYHFARPQLSSGVDQAALLVSRVMSLGWNPAEDIWALDIEEGTLSGAALANWITDFMETAKAHLGDRGFLYVGWPYFVGQIGPGYAYLLTTYRWWLPAYGPNDGEPHGYASGGRVPVLHQYTSNPYDKSRIIRPEVWDALFASQPVPPPPPPVTIDHGDKPVKTTDTTRKLDDHGRGYFDMPKVVNADVLSFGVIGVPDPDQGWDKVHIPVVAFTLSTPEKTPRFVITGGAPGQTVTVRVTHL